MDLSRNRHVSPWYATMTTPHLGQTSVPGGACDVVVVGAGVTGLTTALLLAREGVRVVVLEAGVLGEHAVTLGSTVKVTVGHSTVYSAIESKNSREAAAGYAAANRAGFEEVRRLAAEVSLDCAWEGGLEHVIYAEDDDGAATLEREAAVVQRLGLPVTSTPTAPLPFPVRRTLVYRDQAQFHPGAYVVGLATAFVQAGGVLVERARVSDVTEGDGGCLVASSAGDVIAQRVILATHYPILNRGAHFARLSTRRSYGVAGVLPAGTGAGMTISVGSPTRSTRRAALEAEDLLVVVGEGHPVGHADDTAERCGRLRAWARERYGVEEFRYEWSAQEVASEDGLPFVGYVHPAGERVLLATGFDGWGMTNGTAAALVLRDLVLGHENPWASVLDARRATTGRPRGQTLKTGAHVAATWLKDKVKGAPSGTLADVGPGQGAVLDIDGAKVAVHADDGGAVHAVSAVCTHMGCLVRWNAAETSWDCPCHGSRFDVSGEVLHSPAVRPLAPVTLPGGGPSGSGEDILQDD